MSSVNGVTALLLTLVGILVSALILYAVIRAAVRDGIKQALDDPDIGSSAEHLLARLRERPAED